MFITITFIFVSCNTNTVSSKLNWDDFSNLNGEWHWNDEKNDEDWRLDICYDEKEKTGTYKYSFKIQDWGDNTSNETHILSQGVFKLAQGYDRYGDNAYVGKNLNGVDVFVITKYNHLKIVIIEDKMFGQGMIKVANECVNNDNDWPNNESVNEDKIEPQKDPEPKFIIYSGTITVPYYSDNPEFGGVTNYYTLKLSLDYDKASLDGPMTRIREIEYGYKFIEGQLSGIWFFPTNEYVMIMNEDNTEFGKLTFDKYEYDNSSEVNEYNSEIIIDENQSPSIIEEIIYEDDDLEVENEEFSYENKNISYEESEIKSKPISYIKINDPDGYTNVRSGKSSSTDIIHQIFDENQLFKLIDDSENWWKIEIDDGGNEAKTGFIYYTKVLKVEYFTIAEEKAYFHLKPNEDYQNRAYVIKGDILLCQSNIENGFRNCTYVNSKGDTTNGYVIANQLQ